MKYFSLFSGIGGFELGIKLSKTEFDCVGYSEIDPFAVSIYTKNFTDHKNYGDITKFDTSTLPDFDLLVGGFPCQAFSIAGKRRGFEDARGTLFFEIARVLRDKRPRYFLFENVPGLLNHDRGQTFQTILKVLTELGYGHQWQVLDSKNHGVAQNRRRVFIVGHLRGEPRPKIFPFRGEHQEADEKNKSTCLDANYGKGIDNHGARTGVITHTALAALTERRTEEAKRIRRETRSSTGVDWCPRRGKELVPRQDGLANTVTTGQTKESLLTDGLKIRRFTPLEAERLQGFPDEYTKYGIDKNGKLFCVSDTQRYKVLGNAVTVTVIKNIISAFINSLNTLNT